MVTETDQDPLAVQDEREKKRRRKSIMEERKRRKSLLPGQGLHTPSKPIPVGAKTPLSATPSPAFSSLLPEEINERYEKLMKLAADNKINSSNSWNFALIDYFYDMSLFREGDSINFQKASCTLDGCVKIYSYRVDSVASETGKLLGGLTTGSKGRQAEDDLEDSDEPRKKRKTTRSTSTLEKSWAALNVKKFDLSFDVDPLFKKTTAAFDEASAKGLLMNQLSMDKEGHILFDSMDTLGTGVDENDNATLPPTQTEQDCNLELFIEKFQDLVKNIDTLQLCPTLQEYEFFDGSLELAFEKLAILEDDVAIPESLGNLGGFEVGGAFTEGDFVGGALDLDPDNDDDSLDQAEEPLEEDTHQAHLHFTLTASDDPEELYAYFDQAAMRNWAGPEHWKRIIPKGTGTTQKKTISRKPKEKETINFLDGQDVDVSKLFEKGDPSSLILKSYEKLSGHQLLPPDLHLSSKSFTSLFLKPNFSLKQLRESKKDSSHYTTELGIEGDPVSSDDEMDGMEGFESLPFQGSTQEPRPDSSNFSDEEFGEQLVEQPKMIKTDYVKFARKPKKVDVQKLKENIWTTLKLEEGQDDQFESSEDPENKEVSSTSQPRQFSSVVQELSHIYSAEKLQDISVPFCFICLLHLANEKNLKIEEIGDGKDLSIAQDMF